MRRFTKKKILTSAVTALLCAGAGLVYADMNAPALRNASAVVMFSDETENESQIDTDISRSISLLRSETERTSMIDVISDAAGVSVLELSRALDVSRMGESYCAEISLSGLEKPFYAPVILGNLINRLRAEDVVDDFAVISYCDMEQAPQLPYTSIAVTVGGIAGIIVYILMSMSAHGKMSYERMAIDKQIRAERASSNPIDLEQAYITSALKKSVILGKTQSSAPEGLEKSGYMAAASKLREMMGAMDKRIILTAPACEDTGDGEIPFNTRFTAYLSCALAQLGERTLVVECCLKEPALHKLFKKTGAGGVSHIAAGDCAVWDAIVPEARRGVDIISQNVPYPAPAAAIACSAFGDLMKYLSQQYDYILLHAPRAWCCDEWEPLMRQSTAVITVTENDLVPDMDCVQGMLNEKEMPVAIATVIGN